MQTHNTDLVAECAGMLARLSPDDRTLAMRGARLFAQETKAKGTGGNATDAQAQTGTTPPKQQAKETGAQSAQTGTTPPAVESGSPWDQPVIAYLREHPDGAPIADIAKAVTAQTGTDMTSAERQRFGRRISSLAGQEVLMPAGRGRYRLAKNLLTGGTGS